MIIVKLQGGLGNQMFQYAIGRALSIKQNTTLKLDLSYLLDRTPTENCVFRNYELDVFNIDIEFASSNDINKYICPYINNPSLAFWRLQRIFFNYRFYKERKFSFDVDVLNLKGSIYLDGFWQSPKYFNRAKDTILADYSFKCDLPYDIYLLATEIQNSNSICLHVRRGDYVSLPNANKTHGVKSLDYFNSAVLKISSSIRDFKIYVFSDDINWCVENIKFDAPITFVEHDYPSQNAIDYFRLMLLCNHFIISNSTFAWWAAWLNQNPNKIVIAPKQWFNDPKIDTSDLIPDNWIRI